MSINKAFALKLFAIVLSVLLIFSAFPVSALEGEEPTESETAAVETLPEETVAPTDEATEPEPTEPEEGEVQPGTEPSVAEVGTDNPNPDIQPPTEPPMTLSDGFYLVGPTAGESADTGWAVTGIRANQKFFVNPANADEMMLYTTLEEGRSIKVVKVADGAIAEIVADGKDKNGEYVWYPDGNGGEYTVEAANAGEVAVFFSKEENHNDWTLCKGHLFITKEIESGEGGGSSTPVVKDETDPTLTFVGYAKDKKDDQGNVVGIEDWQIPEQLSAESWVSASDNVYAKLTAKDNDGGFGINDNSFMVKDSSGKYRNGNAKYIDGFYYVKLIEEDPVTISVKDNADNSDTADTTKKLYIDKDAPTKDDIAGITFKKHDENNSFLNILTFGLYSKDAGVDVTVTVKPNNGSPISVIELSDGETPITTDNTVQAVQDGSNGTVYQKTFNLPDKDTAYDLKVSNIKDYVGYELKESVAVLSCPLFAEDKSSIEHLYEIASVTDKVLPSIEVLNDTIAPVPVNDVYEITDADQLSMDAEIKEPVTGLDESSIKAYFGSADVLKPDDKTGAYDFTKSGVAAVTLTNVENGSTYGTEELSGKLLTKKVRLVAPIDKTAATDTYRLVLTATNNSGRSFTKSYDFNVDNTKPTIDSYEVVYLDGETAKPLAENEWTDKEVQVRFKATDAGKKFGKGVSSFMVTGTASGELAADAVKPVEGKEDTYYFTVDAHEGFEIVAYDGYGHASDPLKVDASEVRYDNEEPVIGEILYGGVPYDESSWQPEKVVISFTVTDKSQIEKIKGTWLSGKVDTTVTIVGEDDDPVPAAAITRSETCDDEKGWTFSFETTKYQKYTIKAKDKAGNETENATETQCAKLDKADPYFTRFEFKPQDNTVLNILTFGLYSPNNVEITVNAEDISESSGITEISATYGEPPIPLSAKDGSFTSSGENIETNGKATASITFILPLNNTEAYDPALLSFTVKDASGRNTTKKLSELSTDENVTNNIAPATGAYEIVVNDKAPHVSSIALSPEPDYVDGDYKWYKGDKDVEASVNVFSAETENERIAHLHSVNVTLNNQDVTAKSEGAGQFTYYGEADKVNQKIDKTDVKMSIRNVDEHVRRASDGGDLENTVTVSAESNNGEKADSSNTFYIDDVAPQVTNFEFDADGKEVGVTDVTEGVVKTDYGYFFKYQTKVYVYVTDTIEGTAGSGVKSVTYYGTSADTKFGSKPIAETEVPAENFIITEDGKIYIEFIVEAGFKGNIFASAEDNVGNKGHVYSADGTIVENDELHREASAISMTIASNPVAKDNQGIDLFDSSVAVDFSISDLYSGLKDVSYRILDTNHTEANTEFTTQNIAKDGAGDWTVNDGEKNLIYTISKRITVDAATYNDNNVRIQLKGTDNAGFEIAQIEKAVSIDITAPIVQVEYNPVLGTANHVGENYYFNADRTATITVTERNFDPSNFDLSKYVALEGNRPALVGGDKWSTDYTYEPGTGNEQRTATHKATITFAEDGKYDVDFDFKDLAGHNAEKKFEREIFYIDKTKPVMTVELVSEANAANGSYYNKTVTARITVVEHNFSADDPYFVYTGSATGADNHTAAGAPPVSGWTTDGDTHRATITFDADGMYSFRIAFKDLANNAGEDFSQTTFYVDQTINAPVITGVESTHAYSGSVIPVIDYEDNNFDYNNGYSYTLIKHWFDLDKMEQLSENADYDVSESRKDTDTGLVVTYSDFERSELTEGVYELKAHIKDLANNEADSENVLFSVNRFGSVFVLGSANTTSLVENFYTADAPDVAIKEINVNRAKEQRVSISHNSATKQLNEGSDYTIKHSGGSTSWYESLYVINASNFEDDGEYTVTVTSVDTFDNTVTNLTANTDSEHERNCPVTFVVDKQNPEVKISGVDEDGYYSEAEKTLHIVCLDENIDKESIEVKLDDQVITVPEEYINLELVGEVEIDLPINAENGETKHKIEVAAKDLADNSGDDHINAFTLSATFFTMFFHNTVALIVTGAVLAALIALAVVLIVKKRKGAAK